MKVQDLMVGDWVSYKGKMPCKITAICKDTAVVDNDTEQDWRIDYDKLTPIPLTAEILEKNFTATPNTFWSSIDYFYHNSSHTVKICRYIVDGTWEITYGEDTIGGKPEWNMYVTYVHQLQHALRLAGIDKEITI